MLWREPEPPLVIGTEAGDVVSAWLYGENVVVDQTTKVVGVQMDQGQLRVQLGGSTGAPDCALPSSLKPPGGIIAAPIGQLPKPGTGTAGAVFVSGPIELRSYVCPDGDRARAVESWLSARARVMPTGIWRRQWEQGVLAPLVRTLGVPGGDLAACLIVFASAVAGLCVWWLGPGPWPGSPEPVHRAPPPAWFLVALGLVLCLAVGVAIHRTGLEPLDTDEVWARTGERAVLGDDHDAFIHPPLYRALQSTYERVALEEEQQAGVKLRVISLAATVLGLLMLAAWIALSTRSNQQRMGGLVALAGCGAMTGWQQTMVLARPYGLAAWWLLVMAAALFGPFISKVGPLANDARWRLAVAMMAAGLALWTDLVAGVIAASLLLAWVAAGPRRLRTGLLLGAGFSAWAIPIVPGAVAALTKTRCVEELGVCEGPRAGLGGGNPIEFVLGVSQHWTDSSFALLPIIVLVPWFILMTWRSVGWRRIVPWATVLLLTIALPAGLALRARNVAYLPWLLIVLTLAVAERPPLRASIRWALPSRR